MKLSCYIIDDEPLAIEVLLAHAAHCPDLEIMDTFQNGPAAFRAIAQRPVDLLFLDINMPLLSGLDLIRSLAWRPQVILTTAHREFAVEGFDLDVTDYLVKPIRLDRFLQAVSKVERKLSVESGVGLLSSPQTATRLPEPDTRAEVVLVVKSGRKKERIPVTDIHHLESRGDYVDITTSSRVVRASCTLSSLESQLERYGFIRIHRSFIVPVSRIDRWSASRVELADNSIPIGRTYRKIVGDVLAKRS